MTSSPTITVITPSFNSAKTIEATIKSVLSQKYLFLEHIVMDGGSKDGTLEILKKYPHLIVVSEKDEGHWDAMNKGILRATGEWIVVLNSDDCFRSGVLAKVAGALNRNPDWDAFFGDVVYVDSQGQEIYRREEACYSYTALRCWRNYVNHQTLFVRKSVYNRIGVYKHKEFLNTCDYEFTLRLGREKCRVGHIREYLVDFRYHDHGQSADLRVTRNMALETEKVRSQYGISPQLSGLLSVYGRALRQIQKLVYRGKCDLIPGHWLLKKHMRAKTDFSSNCGVNELK